MQAELTALFDALTGKVACVVLSMDQDGPRERYALNPGLVFPAASLAKIPILVTLAHVLHEASSPYTWETRLEVTDAVRVPSAGVLADLSSTLRPTIQDLAHLMITISDNSASNLLLDLVSRERVNSLMLELGLQQTRLERRFMDFAARQAGRDNWTTAADMVLLFKHICSEHVPERARLLHMLLRQNDYHILPAYWEEDGLFAHKTGELAGIMHDAGILFRAPADPEPLIIVALTAEQPDIPFTNLTLARAGRAIRQSWLSSF